MKVRQLIKVLESVLHFAANHEATVFVEGTMLKDGEEIKVRIDGVKFETNVYWCEKVQHCRGELKITGRCVE